MLSANKFNIKRPLKPLLVFTGVLFLDQLLKIVFLEQNSFQENYGALFGWRVDQSLAWLALAGLCVFVYLYHRSQRGKSAYALALALMSAGIVSNLIDRTRLGFIVDYIDLSSLFIFNLADLALLSGAGLFIWKIIRE